MFGVETGESLNPKCVTSLLSLVEASWFGGCFLQQALGLLYSYMAG